MEGCPDGWSEELKGGVKRYLRELLSLEILPKLWLSLFMLERLPTQPTITQKSMFPWGRVRVEWWSHDANGVTSRDIALAETTNRLYS